MSRAKRSRTSFFCRECGREEPQWSGRCPACGAWDAMLDAPQVAMARSKEGATIGEGARSLIDVAREDASRSSTGIAEMDRVLGGGLVPGSVILVGGEPGVGKSTLLLQMVASMVRQGRCALYASGEESPRQIRLRAERTDCVEEGIQLMGTTDVESVCQEAARLKPDLLIIDSIQTMADARSDGIPGSPSQIRSAALRFVELAKGSGISTVLVGHVTKEGEIAGPKLLEHMVDAVLSFEGDPQGVHRFLRAVKNRFGAVSEVGVFVMEGKGLIEVPNPSSLFIHRGSLELPGACLSPVSVGTRCYVVEVQGLVTENSYTFGRRLTQGYDLNRLNLILSVIEKRLGISLGGYDVCVNVTGGLQVREPALDLAVAVAILSSQANLPVPSHVAWSGEIGLSGEIRPVHHVDQRADEASRVGCSLLILPEGAMPSAESSRRSSLRMRAVADLPQINQILRESSLMP